MLKISALRKAAKLTQSELAERIGLKQQALSKYEVGSREPDIDTLCKIADFFGVTVDYLLERDDIGADIKVIEKQVDLPADEQELLNYYRSCSSTGKKYILSKAMICSIEGLPDQEQKNSDNSEGNEGKLLA